MRYKKIFIDTSNFYHRAYCCSNGMTTTLKDGKKIITGGIYISFNMLKRIEKEFLLPDGKVFFLFDNTHSGDNKRKEIDPDYKANRTKKDESFYRSLDMFHLILLAYKENIRTVKVAGKEADDLVDPLVKKFPEDPILLVSNDLDWFRSISDKVHVAKYEKKDYTIYDRDAFIEKFQFEPSINNLCMYKSFRGDKGDNVPIGVPRIREKDLILLIKNFNSIKEILLSLDTIDYISDNVKQKIKENYSRLLLNYSLVQYEDVVLDELEEGTYFSRFQASSLYSLYSTLKFDIEKFDPRVSQFYPKKDLKEKKNFFEFDKIPRV